MALTLAQTKTALAPNRIAYFLGKGGTGSVSYAVTAGGAGGTINATTGLYTAPATASLLPAKFYDTVTATDSAAPTPATATATILVADPLSLVCDIIQTELALANGRVFLWNQKIFQPTSDGIYVVISVPRVKAIGNNAKPQTTSWASTEQYLTLMATMDLNVISRDNAALFRKEEVLMTLMSRYSQAQQESNGFHIGRIPPGAQFTDLSGIDGAAIPYRYHISVNVQYTASKIKADDYFDTFQTVAVVVNK
jgi:hypothetical protein